MMYPRLRELTSFIFRLSNFGLLLQISRCKIDHSKREQTQVFCLRCPSNSHPTNPIAMEAMPAGAVQIENSNLVLLFDEDSRLLKQVRQSSIA